MRLIEIKDTIVGVEEIQVVAVDETTKTGIFISPTIVDNFNGNKVLQIMPVNKGTALRVHIEVNRKDFNKIYDFNEREKQ